MLDFMDLVIFEGAELTVIRFIDVGKKILQNLTTAKECAKYSTVLRRRRLAHTSSIWRSRNEFSKTIEYSRLQVKMISKYENCNCSEFVFDKFFDVIKKQGSRGQQPPGIRKCLVTQ